MDMLASEDGHQFKLGYFNFLTPTNRVSTIKIDNLIALCFASVESIEVDNFLT